jgi:hypothetical protein
MYTLICDEQSCIINYDFKAYFIPQKNDTKIFHYDMFLIFIGCR